MKPLIVIPARGGSKGILRKNIKELNGKPLIYYTLDIARSIFKDDIIFVSTEDIEIKEYVEKTGLRVPFLRPAELATDEAGTYEVLLHALKKYKLEGYAADIIVLLQVTSPFRKAFHIKEALEMITENIDMVVSVTESDSNPYYNIYEEDESGNLFKSKEYFAKQRQACPQAWRFNGSIYIINAKSLENHTSFDSFSRIIKYPMEQKYSIDIDTQFEWDFSEFMLTKKILDL